MLEVIDLYKTYEGQPLLRGVSFSAAPGETICLLGRSGSGKSTLLRIIAGLETAEAGAVRWQGEDLAGVPVHRRGFGLMFQDYALFPHRSVAENVAFGLRMQGEPREAIRARVSEALEKVNLAAFANRRVTDLSGGEQQRVALARALAPRPRLLMLDEPLGALDRALREQLQDELRRVLHESGIPAIYVTHDQEEAFALADRLVLLHDGRVEQSGTPAEVYAAPVSPWAAEFLGLTNLIKGEVTESNPLRVRTALGEFAPACLTGSVPAAGARVTLLLRPSGGTLSAADDGVPNVVRGVVEEAVFRGEHYQIGLRVVNGALLTFMLPQPLMVGAAVCLRLPADAVQCLGGAHE